MYGRIIKAIGLTPGNWGPVLSTEGKLWELNKFSPREGELHNLHYHHPTNMLTIFTDGLCKNGSVAGGVFFGPNSKRNRAFCVSTEPISMLAKLHAIKEALVRARWD